MSLGEGREFKELALEETVTLEEGGLNGSSSTSIAHQKSSEKTLLAPNGEDYFLLCTTFSSLPQGVIKCNSLGATLTSWLQLI